MNKTLRSSEITIVGSLLLIIVSLVLIAKISAAKSSSPNALHSFPSHELIPVQIRGAVAKPGIYQVLPGTELRKVLAKSRPNRFANLRKVDLSLRIEVPLALELQMLTEIEIRIEGEVQIPTSLTLPMGAKLRDLRDKITLNPEADLTFFKSKRLLKDGEVLKVPRRRD